MSPLGLLAWISTQDLFNTGSLNADIASADIRGVLVSSFPLNVTSFVVTPNSCQAMDDGATAALVIDSNCRILVGPEQQAPVKAPAVRVSTLGSSVDTQVRHCALAAPSTIAHNACKE